MGICWLTACDFAYMNMEKKKKYMPSHHSLIKEAFRVSPIHLLGWFTYFPMFLCVGRGQIIQDSVLRLSPPRFVNNDYVRTEINKLWKILKEMGIPDHLTCLLRNLYAGQEATVRT